MSTSTILTLDRCTAEQLVEKDTVLLASGTLALVRDSETRGLTLLLGELAFPLSASTPFFTHAQNPLWYFFKAPGIETSYVRITFPEAVIESGSVEEELRDRFENALIKESLLKAGIGAVGDEVGATFKQDATNIATLINSQVKSHLGLRHTASQPASNTFASLGHSLTDVAATGSSTLAGYASTAVNSFLHAAIGVGETVTRVVETATAAPKSRRERMRDDLAEAGYSTGEDDDLPVEVKEGATTKVDK
ncbi:hypothetical protein FRB99_006879 [Tulasnella sp. 403]|nr:hypothetical protein FRB99_006879 [Tulasnella sp. 403]